MYCLSRIQQYLSSDALETTVHTLISSKLDYWNSLLDGLPKSNILKYHHNMNSMACMISGCSKFDHVNPVLVDLHWLPIEYWVNFKLLFLTYQTLYGLAPAYITDLLKSYSPMSSLHSARQELLCLPNLYSNKLTLTIFEQDGRYLASSMAQWIVNVLINVL